ncbi:MAG: phage terminase large subunit family protein, partial [Hyphomicrobiales bacterium]
MLAVSTDPKPINDAAFAAVLAVPPDLSCADWSDRHFVLSAESSNSSGAWATTPVQRAILNAMGSDAIERVNLFKPARMGGTKMLVAANAYMTAHKRRNVGFYQPTQTDSESFVKTEIEPSIRDCEPWSKLLLDSREGSKSNTQSIKKFLGSTSHYKGGHSANNFR